MIHALHGALGHHSDWKPVAQALGRHGHSLRAMDLWRFLDCCAMSLPDTGKAISTEVEAASAPKPVLLGYSMGARLAMHSLLATPELWAGAVLIGPHPGLADPASQAQRLAADTEWAARALRGDWQDFLADWDAQSVLRNAPAPDRHFLKQRRQAIALSFTSWSLGSQQNLLPRLGEIRCPVLWITGDRDQKFTALARRATALSAQIRHLLIAGGGHRLIFSHPGQLADAIHPFIQSLD